MECLYFPVLVVVDDLSVGQHPIHVEHQEFNPPTPLGQGLVRFRHSPSVH
jgi:hypothetical protein